MPGARAHAPAERRARSVDRELRSPGTRLDAPTQSAMLRRLGADFGDVRVHTGPSAEASAAAVGARAFTVGRHVVFGAGQFRPATSEGRGLLAHELTHVIQQRSAAADTLAGFDIDPDDTAEAQARRVGELVVRSSGSDEAGTGGTDGGQHTAPETAARTPGLQRSACDDAARLHEARAGRSESAAAARPPTTGAPADAETDAAWASAASTIDFALAILEHPVTRSALGSLPVPVVVPPQTRELVRQALPHVREIWELISDPVRLMTEAQGFVDEHLAGVPEEAQQWFADAAFGSLRGTRHMVGISLALGDATGELLSNWTEPFRTAWHEFTHPLDVDAEMADLACIQERYAAGEIDTLETFTAIYGWLVGWVNRYAVYVGIALIVGGAAVGALGGGGVGGAGGAAAGGVGAAPGAAVGGGGGAAAGAGAGWALSEEIGLGILAANAVHMLLQVVSAGERLADNDRAAADDARAGRTPTDATVADRLRHDEEAYTTVAHVLLGLGIMGVLVLLAAFGSQFARVALRGLSGRYPSLGTWLAESARGLQQSRAGRTLEELQSGRRRMQERLSGEPSPTEREPTTSTEAAVDISISGERHQISVRNGRIWLCSDDCGYLIEKVEAMLEDIPQNHRDRASFEQFLDGLRDLEAHHDEYEPIDFWQEVRVRGRRLDELLALTDDPDLGADLVGKHLPEGLDFPDDGPRIDDDAAEDHRREQPRFERISDANKMELQDSGWLKKNLSPDLEPRVKFMKWLEQNHLAGEPHEHLRPGSPYATMMLKRFLAEEMPRLRRKDD